MDASGIAHVGAEPTGGDGAAGLSELHQTSARNDWRQSTSRHHHASKRPVFDDEGGCAGRQGDKTNSGGLHVHVCWCVL